MANRSAESFIDWGPAFYHRSPRAPTITDRKLSFYRFFFEQRGKKETSLLFQWKCLFVWWLRGGLSSAQLSSVFSLLVLARTLVLCERSGIYVCSFAFCLLCGILMRRKSTKKWWWLWCFWFRWGLKNYTPARDVFCKLTKKREIRTVTNNWVSVSSVFFVLKLNDFRSLPIQYIGIKVCTSTSNAA